MICADDVTVRYDRLTALDNVSLSLEPGTVTAIVGSDGAGKTTLLKALLGQVPIESGTVTTPPLRSVGYQPSHSGVWQHLSVNENLAFVGRAYRLGSSDFDVRRQDLLHQAGLAAASDRPGMNLSGGMRQKLGVIMAMLHQPSLLLLDEPTTGVDPVSRVDLWQLMTTAAAQGATVGFATTYLDEAERASNILVLDHGQTLATGAADSIVASTPGAISTHARRPNGNPEHIWRRGAAFRQWHPPGTSSPAESIPPDLEDSVIAFLLARATSGRGAAEHD